MEPLLGRPVILGEVLFDVFPGNVAVLGGAPFNVAWHLKGFGLSPLLISRIGEDSRGEQILSTMQTWGMDTAGIQIDPTHPTGVVRVALEEGQPQFTILPNQAYDFMDADTALMALEGQNCSLLYHGTLIARGASQAAVQALRQTIPSAFVDLNLRAPWWEIARVRNLLQGARWVKMNGDELAAMTELGQAQLADRPESNVEAMAHALCLESGWELLALTLGAEGAWLLSAGKTYRGKAVVVETLIDTVGAGDAFSAVTLLGLHRGWSLENTLSRALDFAAALCGMRGASPQDPGLYASYLEQWG
jgi:fructokinase